MKFVIMHQTVTSHDAIGNDIEYMWSLLNEKYESYVFAEYQLNKNVRYINYDELQDLLNCDETYLIYHHSNFWTLGEKILDENKYAGLIIRYHNITLPIFFKNYCGEYEKKCIQGREQTTRFTKKHKDAMWLVDSHYNAKDLAGFVEEKQICICPPFNKIEEWDTILPDEEILEKLIYKPNINLLFVGRVVPNKGHLQMLQVLNYFRSYHNENICLNIIGKTDMALNKYNNIIKQYIIEHKMENSVNIVGEINNAQLAAYYLGSDIYLSCSQHEGFCVPLIEAQYFNLPIIAYNSSAIGETIGENQIVYNDFNYKKMAAAIHVIANKREYYDYLTDNGFKNYKYRFRNNLNKDIFFYAVKKVQERHIT